MAEWLFWLAVLVLGYALVGFPLLVAAKAAVLPRPLSVETGPSPSVTVVIAAHNEEAAIAAKIGTVLDQDYPDDLLDCVVVSDGSTDRTVALSQTAGGESITVLDLPRGGKATALNQGVAAANGEILVFTDANSQLAPDAISRLVEPFGDPEVGGVAGDQRYLKDGNAGGEQTYWDFDRVLKVLESRAGNVISATGALYAVRRDLAVPVPDGVTDDFAMSTAVIDQGRRLVFAKDAAAFEPPSVALDKEYRRKVRVMTRGLRSVQLRRRLLDPRRSGFYALQLFSHKVLRRLVAIPLLVLFVASLVMWNRNWFHTTMLAGQVALYGSAAVGLVAAGTRLGRLKLFSLPAFFVMVNAAALHALWNVLTGRRINLWSPDRQPGQVGP